MVRGTALDLASVITLQGINIPLSPVPPQIIKKDNRERICDVNLPGMLLGCHDHAPCENAAQPTAQTPANSSGRNSATIKNEPVTHTS
jgi:hypothetical protein